MQSDPQQAPNTKEKKQMQQNNHKMNRWQAELATLSQTGGKSVSQTLTEYILNIYNSQKKNMRKWNTA